MDGALRNSAHNLANRRTAGFRRERAVITARAEGSVEASARRSQAEGASIEEGVVAQ